MSPAMRDYYDRYVGGGYNMPKEDNDKAGTELHVTHSGSTVPPWARPAISMPPDPMVKFLEEQVAKLETRLRASEAHHRRYAVACGKYRGAACELLGLMRQAYQNEGEVDVDAANDAIDSGIQDIDAADALIDPVATEVVQ